MSEFKCSCKCKNISFELPNEPDEIARCFCSICLHISSPAKHMSFAKYDRQILNNIDQNKILIHRSSDRAVRGFCVKCNDPVYMLYDNSANIWINEGTFRFFHADIDTYDIYVD